MIILKRFTYLFIIRDIKINEVNTSRTCGLYEQIFIVCRGDWKTIDNRQTILQITAGFKDVVTRRFSVSRKRNSCAQGPNYVSILFLWKYTELYLRYIYRIYGVYLQSFFT